MKGAVSEGRRGVDAVTDVGWGVDAAARELHIRRGRPRALATRGKRCPSQRPARDPPGPATDKLLKKRRSEHECALGTPFGTQLTRYLHPVPH